MTGVWQVTDARDENGVSILSTINFPVTVIQLAEANSVNSTAGPMFMNIVYGNSKYTQIASQVQILSGRRQHVRDEAGRISGSEAGTFEAVEIGPDCWIGASAIIMAAVGAGTTIGAGAVVVNDIPGGVVAVGNPARVVRETAPAGRPS
jgi:acetyltransferase-like isoleucine patch superfamily enzyme